MRLYYNVLRSGVMLQTARSPVEEPPHVVEASVGILGDWWYNAALGLSYLTQKYLAMYFWDVATYTLRLSPFAVEGFVVESITASAQFVIVKHILAASILTAAAILVFYIWDKPIRSYPDQEEWGSGWMLRYEEHVWEAVIVYWDSDGTPVFRITGDYGNIILGEARNVSSGIYRGDGWRFNGIWAEVERRWPFWYTYQWWSSLQGFVGYCTKVNYLPPFYKLQKQYYGNLPML